MDKTVVIRPPSGTDTPNLKAQTFRTERLDQARALGASVRVGAGSSTG